jgi:hypothetical protein
LNQKPNLCRRGCLYGSGIGIVSTYLPCVRRLNWSELLESLCFKVSLTVWRLTFSYLRFKSTHIRVRTVNLSFMEVFKKKTRINVYHIRTICRDQEQFPTFKIKVAFIVWTGSYLQAEFEGTHMCPDYNIIIHRIILKYFGTHVYLIETTCRVQDPCPYLQGQGGEFVRNYI